MVRSALGIAIYGMFLAILVPPARQSRPIALAVLLSGILSLLFSFLPGLRMISGGWRIILCALAAALVAALRSPLPEEPAES